MTTGERIKKRREELHMSQFDLALKCGYNSRSTINKIELNQRNLNQSKIKAIADALNTTPSYIMGWDEDESDEKGVWIPVRGRVAAGLPSDAIEDITDYEEISAEMANRGDYIALVVKGDSMEPKFTNGDVVIARCQPDVESGEIAIIMVGKDDATIKKVQKFDGGINLVPSNPTYPVLTYTEKQIVDLPVTILGKVVELRAKF